MLNVNVNDRVIITPVNLTDTVPDALPNLCSIGTVVAVTSANVFVTAANKKQYAFFRKSGVGHNAINRAIPATPDLLKVTDKIRVTQDTSRKKQHAEVSRARATVLLEFKTLLLKEIPT